MSMHKFQDYATRDGGSIFVTFGQYDERYIWDVDGFDDEYSMSNVNGVIFEF